MTKLRSRKSFGRAAQPTRPGVTPKLARDTPLNFKVSADFRRDFKTFAAQHNMKLYELLYQCFDALKSKHAE